VSGDDAMIGGRYRLIRRLAAGGMGTVWEGWDERLQRPVAVKQLHLQPGLSKADADVAVQRAMREARLTARLHHPNAVQVYDVVDHDGHPCLIMQYIPSTSLADIVRDRGPLPPAEVARIGTQIAAALAAAHRAGIVHRDVKPGNVLIADDGTAKITDFGISHAFDDVSLTSTGMVSGTPAYLAPEVARGDNSDYSSDVFSLGSTLYMALEGTPPFGTDANPMAVLHKVASGVPTPPSRSGPLAPMLHDMMARDPATRPDMVAVANTLATLNLRDQPRPTTPDASAATTQFIARPPRQPPPRSQPPPRRTPPPPPPRDDTDRRSAWVPLLAAGIVVALAVVLAIVLLSNSGGGNNSASTTTPTQARTTAPKHSPTPSKSKKTSAKPSKSSTPPKTSSAPKSSPPKSSTSASTSTSAATGSPTASQLASAVDEYYRLLPGDTNDAWGHLTKRYQDGVSQGRGNYNKFWKSIDSVDTANSSGKSPGTATTTITYHFDDGRVTTEHTRFGLVRDGGILKIDSSQVLSSQTH
jgi:serine/threonine protein kinase